MRGSVQAVGLKKLLRLVGEWRERGEALQKQFVYRATAWARHELLDHIPSDHDVLRESLQISKVTGTPKAEPAYAIEAMARSLSLGAVDVGKILLYVHAKPHQLRVLPPEVQVLIDYGPWTAATLPFKPDPKIAVVVSRSAGPRSVQKVESARLRDRRVWKRLLEQRGIRVKPMAQQLQLNSQVRALPDVALESAKLEFGLGGVTAQPHWRPTIAKLASRRGTGIITRRREFVKAMTSVGFNAWKLWPKKVPRRIRLSAARKFVPFQKRLGVRIPK